MFKQVMVRNIKGVSGEFPLGSTTILRGPNESGKTAVMEAIRLAITGRAEIGGTGKKISELVEGTSASAIAIHGGGSSSWKCKNGKSVSCDHDTAEDTQGGMPVSVEQFWALSSAEKFALLAGNSICQVVQDIDAVKAEIKAQEAIANQASMAIPEVYVGEPRAKLQEELEALNAELYAHKQATEGHAAREASLSRDKAAIEKLNAALDASTTAILLLTADKKKAHAAFDKLAPLVQRYEEASAGEPKLIGWARSKGLDMNGMCKHFITEMSEACKWVADNSRSMSREFRILGAHIAAAEVPKKSVPIPKPTFDQDETLWKLVGELTPAIALVEAKVAASKADAALEKETEARNNTLRQLHSIENSIAIVVGVHGNPLDQEILDSVLLRKQELEQSIEKCDAWVRFDIANGNRVVAISKASMKIDELDEKLIALNKKREAIVMSILSPIEEKANDILTRAGLPAVKLDIVATAKQATLDVRTGGIQVDALAGSRRLMYGIALLSSIQQLSDAVSPVLLAHCTEMDGGSFRKCVEALNVPRKGNIVLEHWTDAGVVLNGVVDVDMAMEGAAA